MNVLVPLFAILLASIGRVDAFASAASSSSGGGGGGGASASSPPTSVKSNSNTIFGVEASWSSPEWNWGSPFGLGHDCAMKCRQKFASSSARQELVNSLVHADTDTQILPNFEDVKLVLALAWQRARKFDPDMEAYGQVLDAMADLRYENEKDDMEGDKLLVQDMQKRYMWLKPGETHAGCWMSGSK